MRDTRKISGKLPIVVIIIVLVIFMGAGAFVFMAKGKKASASGEKKDHGKKVVLSEWKFDEFVVNLADQSESHYLKVSIVLEVETHGGGGKKGGHGAEAGNPEEAKARDVIITALTRKRYGDLLSEQGKKTLKSEMKASLNEALAETEVHNIYFTSFAMQ